VTLSANLLPKTTLTSTRPRYRPRVRQ